MKKLMIAAVAVAMAAVASAATSNWNWNTGTSVLKQGWNGGTSGKVMSGATVYLLTSANATGVSDYSDVKATLAGLRDGTITSTTLDSMAVAKGTTDSNGQILAADGVKFSITTTGSQPGTTYFYEVILDGDYAFFSNISGQTTPTNPDVTKQFAHTLAASTQVRDTTGTGAWSNPGWYSVVPEPTSGLLLLLGVAGLALKRKRA